MISLHLGLTSAVVSLVVAGALVTACGGDSSSNVPDPTSAVGASPADSGSSPTDGATGSPDGGAVADGGVDGSNGQPDGGTDGGDASVVHGALAVFVSGTTSLAITPGGGVKRWGDGFGSAHPSSAVAVATPFWTSGVASLAVGYEFAACALKTTGAVECVGLNAQGVLGNGSSAAESALPVAVTGLSSGVTAISGQETTMCALQAGAVLCWGDNNSGELGTGSAAFASHSPVNVGIASGAAAIAMGGTHGCALMTNGNVECWGRNVDGEVGVASPPKVTTPTVVSGLPATSKVVAGSHHTCILTTAGGVMCWGNNGSGQLGRAGAGGATPDYATGLTTGVIDVGAGSNETCAILAGGGVKCWGGGTFSSGASPSNVSGLAGAADGLAVSADHACMHVGTGVMCLGYNNAGQVGNGTTTDAFSAVGVSGL